MKDKRTINVEQLEQVTGGSTNIPPDYVHRIDNRKFGQDQMLPRTPYSIPGQNPQMPPRSYGQGYQIPPQPNVQGYGVPGGYQQPPQYNTNPGYYNPQVYS